MWRTFAVDYATKKWQRAGKGWALRNVKLRMSRKLVFVKGMLMCFDCSLNPCNVDSNNAEVVLGQMVSHCFEQVRQPAVEILSKSLDSLASAETAEQIMTSYDLFLNIISDEEKRTHLEELGFEESAHDELFQQLRTNSHQFRDGMERFFFDEHQPLAELTRRYGVF
jgi:hypothetical protein